MKVGDYGFRVVLDTRIDLSQATSFLITFARPDGTVATRPADAGNIVAAVAPTTKPTKVYYYVQQGDLTMPGNYTFQVENTTGGVVVTSEPVEVYIGEPVS